MIEDKEERHDVVQQIVTLSRSQSATRRRRRQRLNQKRRAAAADDPASPVPAASAVIVAAEESDNERAAKKSMRRRRRRSQLKRARADAAAAASAGSDANADVEPTITSTAAASISTPASATPSSLSTSTHNGDTSFQELACNLQNSLALNFTTTLPTPSDADEQSCTAQSCDRREEALREPVEHWQLSDQLEMQWSSEVSSVQTAVLETSQWTAQQQRKHVTQSQKWQQWAEMSQYEQHSNQYLSYPGDQESNYCERAYYIQTNTYTQRVYSSSTTQQQQQVFQRKRRFEEYNPGQA